MDKDVVCTHLHTHNETLLNYEKQTATRNKIDRPGQFYA